MTAFQRTDASKLVDIYYTLEGTAESYSIVLGVSDGSTWYAEDQVAVWGDLSDYVAPGTDRHIVWNPEVHSITCTDSNCQVQLKVDGGTFVPSNTFDVQEASNGHLFGTVRDRDTGNAIVGATVTVTGELDFTYPTSTDLDGRFPPQALLLYIDVPAGEVTIRVESAPDYYTVERKVIIRENSSTSLDVVMTAKTSLRESRGFGVGEVRGKYSGPGQHAYYLDGVLLLEEFTAAVQCPAGGGTVKWEWANSKGDQSYEDPCTASDDTFTRYFQMGSSFSGGDGTLTVVVEDSGGVRSEPYLANFRVVSPPAPLGIFPFCLYLYHDATSSALKYMTPSLSGSDEGMATMEGASSISNDMPVFGGEDLKFGVTFDAHAEINGDGTGYAPFFEAKAETESEIKHKKTKIAGASLNLTATGGATWEYVDGWIPGGWIQFGGNLSFDVPPKPFVFYVGPVPCYWRAHIEADMVVDLKVMAWTEQFGDPPRYLGAFTLDPFPYAEAMLGAGVADVCAVEGYLGGGARMEALYPGSPALQTLEIYLAGGVRVVFWIFKKEWPVLEYTWDLLSRWGGARTGEPVLGMIPRDYLDSSYASFVANVDPGADTCDSLLTHEVPFQTNVFGQSTPDLAAVGGNLLAVWVHDDPNRSDTNRTRIEFSKWSCSSELRGACTWTTPGPVGDDDTADFHPQLAVLGNGVVLVAWENVSTTVVEPGNPDDPHQVQAALDTMKASMAIEVAWYDSTSGSWVDHETVFETGNNGCLDHSPKIAAGLNNTAVLTWIENSDNQEMGTGNTIRYATVTFTGRTWTRSVSPNAVTVEQPILKSSLAYSGATGTNTFLVFSADTANGTETPEDQELYAVSGNCTETAGCSWDSSATSLTSDSVQDANPQVVFYNGNPIVVWYRAGDPDQEDQYGALYKATLNTLGGLSLGPAEEIVTLSSRASSGAADFRLTVEESTGRMAVVWQEASVDGVDMWYAVYGTDGATPPTWSWSKPQRLTCDRNMEHAMAPSFVPGGEFMGNLMVMYDKVQIEPQVRTVKLGCCRSVKIPDVPDFAQTDLYTLWHTPLLDLAVYDEDVSLSPEDAVAGQMVRVRAKVRNLGSLPAVNVTVRFEHSPGLSDEKTGLRLLGGEVIDLETSVDWALPEPSQLHDITVTAEVTPPAADQYPSNNTGTLSLTKPDMVIHSLMVQAAGAHRVFTIRVANNGLATIDAGEDVVLECDKLADGTTFPTTLHLQENVAPGAYRDLSWVWENAEGDFDGSVEVVAIADRGDPPLEESDEDNNTLSVLVSGGTRACCDPDNGVCTEAADCPSGTVPLGLGTDCSPNCCAQPVTTGADTCDQAYVHFIQVPNPGEGPVTITITGNNQAATFGDYLPGGGGTCQLNIFDPEGHIRDQGWWEAFSIDACADVRIDLCCTREISGEIHQPQWDALISECNPCGGLIPSSIVGSHSVGTDDASSGRGAPFCKSDDPWWTFRSLPAGTYWQPVHSATGGHFGDYQMHITVGACPQAACCLEGAVCVQDTPNAGQPCERDVDCGRPTPQEGDCTGDCQMLNQEDCDAAGGYWLGFGVIPPDEYPVLACQILVDPPGVDWYACGTGSCCTGPAQCQDEGDSGETMTKDYCELINGRYVGGAACDYQLTPCPACEIEGEANCQISNFVTLYQNLTSDLTVPPFGVVTADDFIPITNQISSVCVWGTYLDNSAPSPPGDNYEEFSCVGMVEDNFRVRVYTDAGGFPGSLIDERWVTGDNVASGELPADIGFSANYGIPILSYTLRFEPPILLPGASVTYWLEVANNTTHPSGADVTDPNAAVDNTCYWHWTQIFREEGVGNDYSVMGTDDRPEDQGGGIGYVASAASARSTDLAFCLGAPGGEPLPFDPPETPVGSCCMCDESCAIDQDLATCDDDLIGTWFLQNDCAAGLCDPQPGVTCLGRASGAVAMAGLDCGGARGSAGAIKVPPEGGMYAFNTSCAPTDGPYDTRGIQSGQFVHDIWYQYVTNCTGKLVVSMCATGNSDGAYDSVLALYSDRTSECSCPLGCYTQVGDAVNETCNCIADGGAGIDALNSVNPGECWLIRVGGFQQFPGNDAGAGIVDIRCVPTPCPTSEMLEPDTLDLVGDPVNQKVRYLSFESSEADAGSQQAIRVHMVDLPAPYDTWNGTKMFVGPPEEFCENSGKVKPPDCPTAQPTTTFWASTLQCDPYFTDWSAEGVVHVYHEGIIPNGVYDVQAAREDCDLAVDRSWSEPLVVTMSGWADVIRNCVTCPCSPPDGSTGIPTDVTAILDKFKNLVPPTIPCHAITKVRADLDWETPNRRIDITDVTFCLDAFRGVQYPPPAFDDPSPPPWSPSGQCAGAVAPGQ